MRFLGLPGAAAVDNGKRAGLGLMKPLRELLLHSRCILQRTDFAVLPQVAESGSRTSLRAGPSQCRAAEPVARKGP
jgi:hypothetical protein